MTYVLFDVDVDKIPLDPTITGLIEKDKFFGSVIFPKWFANAIVPKLKNNQKPNAECADKFAAFLMAESRALISLREVGPNGLSRKEQCVELPLIFGTGLSGIAEP